MRTPNDPRTDQRKPTEHQPTDPGPTNGGMGSMGSQADEPSLEEKLGASTKAPTAPQHTIHPAKEGIAGFHPDPFAEDLLEGSGEPDTPGDRRLDPDPDARVDTGTGDQLGNTGGSLTGTPPEPVDTSAPQAPDNSSSTSADLDHERSVGMSGGLREEG